MRTGVVEAGLPSGAQIKPYRVLHVLDHSLPIISGYSVRSRSLISAQASLGFKPTVLTGPRHEAEDEGSVDTVFDEVRYHRTKLSGGGIGKRFARSNAPILRDIAIVSELQKQIEERLKSGEFDLVHAHSPVLCGAAASRACKRLSIPFVYEIRAFWEDAAVDAGRTTVGSPRYRATRALETKVVREADAVVGIATHILQDLQKRGISESKLFHISNGVDLSRFMPVNRNHQLAAEMNLTGRHTFAFLGSLYRYEGISWLVDALAELRKHSQDFNVIIVGGGEDLEEIRAAIARTRSADYIRQIDRVAFDEVGKIYSLVDTIVLPRRSVRLTELVTPLKPLEAMAQNKLVLGSDVGGIRELVKHEQTGLLFKSENIPSFVEQALRAINDQELYSRIVGQGRAEVVQNYDWKVLAKKYSAVYDKALQKVLG